MNIHMRRREILAAVLMAPAGFVGYRVLAASGRSSHIELTIATDGDLLAFKPTELTCPSGAHVRLTFFHTGKYIRQDHDWVLTVHGAATAVAQAGLLAGESAGYLPPGDRRVLAATPLCGKGEHVSVEFTAPPPGDYPFMCSYPGHDMFMHGVLKVTPR
jgi:azurin